MRVERCCILWGKEAPSATKLPTLNSSANALETLRVQCVTGMDGFKAVGHGREKPRGTMPGRVTGSPAWF